MTERLEVWMERMERKVDGLRADMETVKVMKDRVEEHHESLYGNGKPGLVLDVDRIKQWRKSIFWWVGVALALSSSPVIAQIVKLLAQLK